MHSTMLHMVLFAACSMIFAAAPISAISLERNVGKVPAYNWDGANTWAKDPLMTPIFKILKQYKLPSASIAYQMNPSPTAISQTPPKVFRKPQAWWAAGFGVDYRAPMRVASVSKPLTTAVWANYLKGYYNAKFYDLWTKNVGPLPKPKDARVLQITIKHLLDHKSGFDNAFLGFDPAFTGKTVDAQIAGILTTKKLLTAPGLAFSYSNFGYMILARLSQGILKKPFITLAQQLFPAGAPVFAASDNVPVAANKAGLWAAEPSLYYVQAPDTEFNVTVMDGNGRIVSNAVTLSWFATQYWIGGDSEGLKFTAAPFNVGDTWAWVWDGSMPGTMAVLVQYITPKGQRTSICIITNTRVPNDDGFFTALNDAGVKFLQKKFAAY